MGIITDRIKFGVGKVIDGVNNGVSKASQLSPEQIDALESERNKYLTELSDKTGSDAAELIRRNMGAIAIEVYQSYLRPIKRVYQPVDLIPNDDKAKNRIRYLRLKRWVIDAEEKNIDKLVNVYESLSGEKCNIALIVHRGVSECEIDVAVVNTDYSQTDDAVVKTYYERLVGALSGNFPGASFQENKDDEDSFGWGIPKVLEGRTEESIALVSNIATDKSSDFISQSMEKLLDGFSPRTSDEEYTIILIASPLMDIDTRKARLFELYTALAPYSSWTTGLGVTDTNSEGATFSLGANAGIGFSQQTGVNAGISVPTPVGIVGAGGNHSFGMSENFGVNCSRASTVSVTLGKNETLTQTYTNYAVKHTLEEIEKQIRRLEESDSMGSWEFAAYILSKSPAVVTNVAHMYLALTQGDSSHLSSYALEKWNGKKEPEDSKIITKSVCMLEHPSFRRKNGLGNDDDGWLAFPSFITPATVVSGKELARSLNLPRKSVSGIPVSESVSFGREPHSLTDTTPDLEIGCAYHMRKIVAEQRIHLSKDELTKHTFITGSTGSGKSNTIYKLLETLGNDGIRFLVIEPAKGEYKDSLGRIEGVVTYGTNPLIKDTKLLRMNPFRFPENTHILEHLDRLVEIFNVCWPMYAAMPAILKDSVERAYVNSGWDLKKSENRYSPKLFPTFTDVVREIRQVLNESDYSNDNKGDYTGALVTRLKSLTNGINGIIFSADDLTDEELFDCNAIVDLSRIGSTETKSLIMGILVLKLQEHRMEQRCTGGIPNDSLNHITVLEEAHNLLKRTSTEQTNEGANMLGKSVEMLANSIAEMRTYGEGFIIADQSPGLLDKSVIRNTNTKIILRLPDFSDRELVGKAAGLNDDQITELARLEKGVAAISQSDWLEPVLCRIDLFNGTDAKFPEPNLEIESKDNYVDTTAVKQSLLDCIMNKEIYRKEDRIDIRELKDAILKSGLDSNVKCDFLDYINSEDEDVVKSLRTLIYDFFNTEQAVKASENCNEISGWVHSVADRLSPSINKYSGNQIDLAMALLIYELSLRDRSYENLLRKYTEVYRAEGRVY